MQAQPDYNGPERAKAFGLRLLAPANGPDDPLIAPGASLENLR